MDPTGDLDVIMAFFGGNPNVPFDGLKKAVDTLFGQESVTWIPGWVKGSMNELKVEDICKAAIDSVFMKKPKLAIFPKRRILTIMYALRFSRSPRHAYIEILAANEYPNQYYVIYNSYIRNLGNALKDKSRPYYVLLEPAFACFLTTYGVEMNIGREFFNVSIIHFITQHACRLATHIAKLELDARVLNVK